MASRFDTHEPDFSWRAKEVEWPVTSVTSHGLSGVIACETKVAWVNPNTGDHWYRGIPIQELAGKATFEEVAYLLVEGKHWKENPEKFQSFCHRLHRVRQMPEEVLRLIEYHAKNDTSYAPAPCCRFRPWMFRDGEKTTILRTIQTGKTCGSSVRWRHWSDISHVSEKT